MKTLSSPRLVLRPPSPDEEDAIFRILVDEIEGPSFTRADFEAEFEFDRRLQGQPLGEWFGRPSLFLKPDGRYVGFCALMPRLCAAEELDGRPGAAALEAELGWAVSNRYRGQGLATEAAALLADYAFSSLRLPRVVAFTEASNLASLRVMQKLNMRLFTHPKTGQVAGILASPAA